MSSRSRPTRDVEAELREGEALFDARLAALRGFGPTAAQEARRRKIAVLAAQGATEGERAAALAALGRFDQTTHAEQDRMQRGGNYSDD